MTQRSKSNSLGRFLQMQLAVAQMSVFLRRETAAMDLERYPWIGELYDRLSERIYELADDLDRLTQARQILVGERQRARLEYFEPYQRPRPVITTTSKAFADALRIAAG